MTLDVDLEQIHRAQTPLSTESIQGRDFHVLRSLEAPAVRFETELPRIATCVEHAILAFRTERETVKLYVVRAVDLAMPREEREGVLVRLERVDLGSPPCRSSHAEAIEAHVRTHVDDGGGTSRNSHEDVQDRVLETEILQPLEVSARIELPL